MTKGPWCTWLARWFEAPKVRVRFQGDSPNVWYSHMTYGIETDFKVRIAKVENPMIKEWTWCDKKFNGDNSKWGYKVDVGPEPATYSITFFFSTEEDKVKFILRWI